MNDEEGCDVLYSDRQRDRHDSSAITVNDVFRAHAPYLSALTAS